MNYSQHLGPLSRGNRALARKNGRVTSGLESLRARAVLAQIDLHEPIARRWIDARTELLREAFADAYRALVGVPPAARGELRGALEAVRDGRAEGEVTVERVVARIRGQLNGPSAGGAGSGGV